MDPVVCARECVCREKGMRAVEIYKPHKRSRTHTLNLISDRDN